ncbi:MAG: hypothetical protein HN380_28300, partial [Victivallales bacterium]|nr:hypothetical protein [Victivallales bacterium]
MDRYRTPGTVPKFFNPAAPIHVTRANLPHWEQEGTTYFVTFRLVDSLPQQKLARWRADREQWLDAHPEPLGDEEWAEYHERFSA